MESFEYHLWHREHVLKKEMESAVSLAYQNENWKVIYSKIQTSIRSGYGEVQYDVAGREGKREEELFRPKNNLAATVWLLNNDC